MRGPDWAGWTRRDLFGGADYSVKPNNDDLFIQATDIYKYQNDATWQSQYLLQDLKKKKFQRSLD